MIGEEIEKLHGLHNTGMTMHERFTMLARMSIVRRGKRNPFAKTQNRTMNIMESFDHQLDNQSQRSFSGTPFRGRSRGQGGLRRSGSEGSIFSMPGLRRGRSNSFGNMSQFNKNQNWKKSNENFSDLNGSVYNGGGSMRSFGSWRRPRGRGRGRGRFFRGRTHEGRVERINGVTRGTGARRVARGSGRRGARRLVARGPPAAPRGRGRGRGITRNQQSKPVPTKEELDTELDQYMAGTKAALDKELDEYMRNAMDFE